MLTFTTHKLGDTTLFRCAGRLVSGTAPHLRDAVLIQSHARAVVLDLAEIGSIDAAGVGILVSLRAAAQANGVAFKLMNLTPRVEDVLEITNLRDVFEVCTLREMLDLLCHAVRQSRSVEVIEAPRELVNYSATDRRTGSNSAA